MYSPAPSFGYRPASRQSGLMDYQKKRHDYHAPHKVAEKQAANKSDILSSCLPVIVTNVVPIYASLAPTA